MKTSRYQPKRYQLKKEAVHALLTGHPWIFRSHLSSAIGVFKNGQWLKLVDSKNEVLGYGIYESEGLIAIRVFKRGKNAPDLVWIRKQLEKALERRSQLLGYTNSFRALHGENDGFPGIVMDVYGDTGVLQTYSSAVDSFGRYIGAVLADILQLKNLVWKFPVRRQGQKREVSSRRLRGHMPGQVVFNEGKLRLTVDINEGQKSGAFLDLRGLRKWLALQKFNGLKVLNLFCYTGTLGLAVEMAGAAEIWNVDVSAGALEFAKKHHSLKKEKHRYIKADIFDWLPTLPLNEKFDVIIVDPPSMASQVVQVPRALKAYRDIYRALLPHLNPHGTLLACCCTSRIARQRFRQEVDSYIGGRLKFRRSIDPEDDHPVGFPEGDYLKLLVYGA